MGKYIEIGRSGQPVKPYAWKPGRHIPRFVCLAATASPAPPPVPEVMVRHSPIPSPVPEVTASPSPVVALPPAPVTTGRTEEKPPEKSSSPLSLNLINIRRTLSLTPEEFSRPIIEDGTGLINRLEAGFSRPSQDVTRMICETWGICQNYLFTGHGPMFEKDDGIHDHCSSLIALLKQYMSVATFDRKGAQYWKGSLVDDLTRLIDPIKLTGNEMSRIIRVLYDYLDVDQFCDLLERMAR